MNHEILNEITLDELPESWLLVPREPSNVDGFIKHVRCEDARFHVLSYSTLGAHCSEPKCVINSRKSETNSSG